MSNWSYLSVSRFVQLENSGPLIILEELEAITAEVKWDFGDFHETETRKREFENLEKLAGPR